MLFKILKGIARVDIADFFRFAPSDTITRQGGLRLSDSVAKSRIRASFFSHRTLRLFRPFIREGALQMSISHFKRHLDRRLQSS